MKAEIIDKRLRRYLLLLAVLALITTLIELWLQNHFQSPLQYIPWVLCGIGLVALLVAILQPIKATLIGLRVIMSIVAIGGIGGIVVHLKENIEFQQEIHPTATLGDFFLKALQGAAPLLAPGILVFAALIAMAATYHHPALVDNSWEE